MSYFFFWNVGYESLDIFLKILFIYLTEREKEITSRQRGRQRERGKQAPRRAGSPIRGSIPGPWYHDLRRRQRLNPLSHPGAPVWFNDFKWYAWISLSCTSTEDFALLLLEGLHLTTSYNILLYFKLIANYVWQRSKALNFFSIFYIFETILLSLSILPIL